MFTRFLKAFICLLDVSFRSLDMFFNGIDLFSLCHDKSTEMSEHLSHFVDVLLKYLHGVKLVFHASHSIYHIHMRGILPYHFLLKQLVHIFNLVSLLFCYVDLSESHGADSPLF